jgi:hypothetical protein
MAKKKQFAGKETKLAKLPLTQFLAGQTPEAPPGGPPPAAAEAESRQLPPSWEGVARGAADPLAAAYLQVIQELVTLQSELPAPGGEAALKPGHLLPSNIPPPHRLKFALRRVQNDLRDLWLFISQT